MRIKTKKVIHLKNVMRDLKEISGNNILDSGAITFLFHELNRKIRNGESVELKEYGGDHSYRTRLGRTKFKYGRFCIPRFKEGIELEAGINIIEGFTSVKILRQDNKYYVIFGYYIEKKAELINLTYLQKNGWTKFLIVT